MFGGVDEGLEEGELGSVPVSHAFRMPLDGEEEPVGGELEGFDDAVVGEGGGLQAVAPLVL